MSDRPQETRPACADALRAIAFHDLSGASRETAHRIADALDALREAVQGTAFDPARQITGQMLDDATPGLFLIVPLDHAAQLRTAVATLTSHGDQ